ncbi:ABC transporter ATP-binding protein [Parapedomonas caeni]
MLGFHDINKVFGRPPNAISVLHQVTFNIRHGEFCAIVGPSGSGKSSLLNLAGLLDRPTSGCITINGQPIGTMSAAALARLRNRLLGFVFQSFHLLPRLSVWQNVALPLQYRGIDLPERKRRAHALLERLALLEKAEQSPARLSGGQQQRVALARALVGSPRLLLADEPTGNLDSVTAAEVMALLTGINRQEGLTMVLVTHDQALARQCHRRITLLDGRVVEVTS